MVDSGLAYPEESGLATYDLGAGEPIMNGVTAVFDTIGINLSEKDPPLIEQINLEAIDNMGGKKSEYCLVTTLWQHPVTITSSKITVYEPKEMRTSDWKIE